MTNLPARRSFGPRWRSGAWRPSIAPPLSLRPATLKEVAEGSDSIGDFGRHLRDRLHALRRTSSLPQAAAMIADEPPRLREKFAQGSVADAWLAACAGHPAGRIGTAAPEWTVAPWRIAEDPLFDDGSTSALKRLALVRAPLAFKRRNIFTPAVDLPLTLRAGRPAKSATEKRKTNAERQRRFRTARSDELKILRELAAKRAP